MIIRFIGSLGTCTPQGLNVPIFSLSYLSCIHMWDYLVVVVADEHNLNCD